MGCDIPRAIDALVVRDRKPQGNQAFAFFLTPAHDVIALPEGSVGSEPEIVGIDFMHETGRRGICAGFTILVGMVDHRQQTLPHTLSMLRSFPGAPTPLVLSLGEEGELCDVTDADAFAVNDDAELAELAKRAREAFRLHA